MSAGKYYHLVSLKENLQKVYDDRERMLRHYDVWIAKWAFLIAQTEKVTSYDLYDAFRKERVRLPVTQEEKDECREDPITTNKIKTIVISWKKDRRVDLPTQMVIDKLTEEFGPPVNNKEWPKFKVFPSDDAAEDWDTNHT